MGTFHQGEEDITHPIFLVGSRNSLARHTCNTF